MSVKTLAIERVGPDRKINAFSSSNEPRAAIDPVGPNGQTGPFSRSNEPRAVFGFFLIQKSDVIYVEICHGRSLRPLTLS
ncbi:hypothetical protein H5410_042205 [Solanum commersonii]|uniref:Uncharacterized protein n=1 Tax=Solanum commersonii TaxID=4109 RepID=A0A9J5XTP1_SOLCO|nr:hypothetical protein H5410_042205 [Solanum commersonii]